MLAAVTPRMPVCSLLFFAALGCDDSSLDPVVTENNGAAAPKQAEAKPCLPVVGPFTHIYDPSIGEAGPWYINDHTIVRGRDQLWHLFGITHASPPSAEEREFAHATSASLTMATWQKRPPALIADQALGETVLWAPYVLENEGMYYMFYCAGGVDEQFQIKLAISSDLNTWTRHPEPLFLDGAYARDPYVMRVGAKWVMYYTATSDPEWGNYVVAYRTSEDLVHWSKRRFAYVDPLEGMATGNTESPYVVSRPEGYYLFIGPRGDYTRSEVFFSSDPYSFDQAPLLAIEAHAAEIIRDLDGSEQVSRAGWWAMGVDVAPLRWNCTQP